MKAVEDKKKELEEIAKELGIDIERVYEAMEEKHNVLNFRNEKEKDLIKTEIIKAMDNAKKSLVFCGDGHSIIYGNPIPVLSSICCILNNIKDDIPKEIIKESIKIALGDE